MSEQIYINGVLMDAKIGGVMSLVFQSPFFTDIDNIVSNRTNSVSFPATKNNLSAIGNAQLQGSESEFAYRKHNVTYYRDGIQIFSGFGTLLSITPTELKFSFTWGNVSLFKKLLDYKIQDLRPSYNDSDIYVPWNDNDVRTSPYYSKNVDTGGYAHPLIKVPVLLWAIEKTCGVTFENKEVFDRYRIPALGNKADSTAKRLQGVIMGGSIYTTTTQWENVTYLAVGPSDKDVQKLYIGEGIFDVSKFDNVKISFNSLDYTLPAFSGNSAQSVQIFACTESGVWVQQIASIPLKKSGTSRFSYSLDAREVVANVSDFSHIRIRICTVGKAQTSSSPLISSCDVNIIPDYDKEQELIYGGIFPIMQNLPDWTVSQLLKNLMKIEGLFAVCPDDKTIRLLSIDNLYDNRSKAIDITERIILDNRMPADQSFSFGNYAQKNHFKYAEDETVKTNADGEIIINNSTLNESADLVNLDFAASDEKDGKVLIPIYTKNEEGKYEYNDLSPRSLVASGMDDTGKQEIMTFAGLDWKSLIKDKYAQYENTIKNTKVLKVSVLIDSVRLSQIDLSIPVYSYEFGHYYAVIQMTTKSDKVAELHLLQLGRQKKPQVVLDGILDGLTVLSDGEEGYYATLVNQSAAVIGTLRADKNYKVCLIRYGYARRGKAFKYTDKVGNKTSSKTSRVVSYNRELNMAGWKKVRFEEGGDSLCWRIIGYDELYTNKLSPHSQAYKYYKGSTLVFDLLDKIVLPPMRTGCVSNSGRIRNRASDGLAELSIAIYHRNDKGKWKIASNICPVRSRTEDKTEYWEFETTNIKSAEGLKRK